MSKDHSVRVRARTTMVGALALLVTIGCRDVVAPLQTPLPQPPDPALSVTPRMGETIDDEFARAASSTVPGFAGFYVDSGTLVIQLVNQSRRAAAEQYVRALRPMGLNATRGVRFQSVQYDFAQLNRYAGRLMGLVGKNGVYALDIDERHNTIWLGVADDAAANVVRDAGQAAGVPAGVIVTEIQPAPTNRLAATTFQDFTDSLRGGFQISNGSGLCTLGFNAKLGTTPIFVSASHCSGTQFGLDATPIYQNTVWPGSAIGSEIVDHALYACQPGASSCRLSEASYFQYNTSRAVDQGYIQRGMYGCYGARCTINVDNPSSGNTLFVFPIADKLTNNAQIPVGGLAINKVGRTSGWTYGQIKQTCVTIGVLRCQYVTDAWSEPGDSGAPMWMYYPDNTFTKVKLLGVLWGGAGTNFSTTYFSPLTAVEAELGAISVCAPGYSC